MVHGFTQTQQCWGELIPELVSEFEVVTIDAPGHGRSSDIAADLVDTASLLAEAGGNAIYLGYSMGARMCLHLGLSYPHLVNALILVSGTAGIEDLEERNNRKLLDEKRAVELETYGLDTFLDSWINQPMFANLDDDARCLDARKTNTASGLASSLRLGGTGNQEPLWGQLHRLTMPVLLIAGADDPTYVTHAKRMGELIGANATVEIIENAGHAAHLEQQETFIKLIKSWIKELPELKGKS